VATEAEGCSGSVIATPPTNRAPGGRFTTRVWLRIMKTIQGNGAPMIARSVLTQPLLSLWDDRSGRFQMNILQHRRFCILAAAAVLVGQLSPNAARADIINFALFSFGVFFSRRGNTRHHIFYRQFYC
jgi:hypothetical protein